MKAYQHHDPVLDKGKAVPHPKQPTRYTYRSRNHSFALSVDRGELRQNRKDSIRTVKGRSFQSVGIFASIAMMLGMRGAHRGR